jgi:hypothetical protein
MPENSAASGTNHLDLDLDLDLSELTVTSLTDTAALPENGASWGSCSCQGSSSCAKPTIETPEF